MKKVRRVCLLLFLAGVLLFPFLDVCCGANPRITISEPPSADMNKMKDLCAQVNTMSDVGFDFLTYNSDSGDVTIEINMAKYKDLSQKGRQRLMQLTLSAVQNSEVSRTNRNKIYNFIADEDVAVSSLVRQLSDDVRADFAGAYSYFKPFSSGLGIILGILVLAIMTALGLTIVVDLSYITIPWVQLAFEEKKKHQKPWGVSIEAWKAVEEAESKSGSDYVNPLSVYFRSKSKQMVAISLCLLYLVSGQLYNFIADVMDYFRGLLP